MHVSLGYITEVELLYQGTCTIVTNIIAQITSKQASIIDCPHNSVFILANSRYYQAFKHLDIKSQGDLGFHLVKLKLYTREQKLINGTFLNG